MGIVIAGLSNVHGILRVEGVRNRTLFEFKLRSSDWEWGEIRHLPNTNHSFAPLLSRFIFSNSRAEILILLLNYAGLLMIERYFLRSNKKIHLLYRVTSLITSLTIILSLYSNYMNILYGYLILHWILSKKIVKNWINLLNKNFWIMVETTVRGNLLISLFLSSLSSKI